MRKSENPVKPVGIFVLAALLCFVLDALTKMAAEHFLQKDCSFSPLLILTLEHNTGLAFSLFQESAWLTCLLPLVAFGAGYWLLRPYQLTRLTAALCGVITGGFLGNLSQRLIFGYVTDMLYFPWLPWFVCNIADIGICCGVAVLAITLIFCPGQWQEKKQSEDETHDIA